MAEALTNTKYYADRWKEIAVRCNSFEEFQREVEDYESSLRDFNNNEKFPLTSKSMKLDFFPNLLPAIETTLVYACHNRLLLRNRTMFNGIDNIAEILWNELESQTNEEHEWLNIFQMDWCKEYLTDNPRPMYPLSCMITREEAAIIIQSFYRGYLIRKIPRVQRFRKFWARVKDRLRRGMPPISVTSEASLLKRCIKCYPAKYASKTCSTESFRQAKLAEEKQNKKRAFLKKCRFISEPDIIEEEEKTCTKNLKF